MPDEIQPGTSGSGNGEQQPPKAPETTPPATPPAAPPKPEGGEEKPKPPTEPEKPKKVVPEKYDLKLPEGSLLKAPAMERIAAIAKERGLSNEEAQALLDADHKAVEELVEANKSAWFAATKADKEFGGDAFEKNAELAKRVIDRFDPTGELKAELDRMGYGNHPAMFKFVTRIGKAMSEDQLVVPGSQTPTGKKSMEEVFYGQPTTKE